MFTLFPAVLSKYTLYVFLPSVLEKSEFKDDSQFFRFYADEEMEGTSGKSKQLQRNDFKLIENILAKSLVVSTVLFFPPKLHLTATWWHKKADKDDPPTQRDTVSLVSVKLVKTAAVKNCRMVEEFPMFEIREKYK